MLPRTIVLGLATNNNTLSTDNPTYNGKVQLVSDYGVKLVRTLVNEYLNTVKCTEG